MRLLRGLVKLAVALAVLAAIGYVLVFVILDQYRFDGVERGSFERKPAVRGSGDARRFTVGLAIANEGDRDVEIRKVGGIGGSALARVRVRMGRRDTTDPARRLRAFEPFELRPGRQRDVRLTARFKCSELGRNERILIDAIEVGYKVGLFEKDTNIALSRRVRIGRRGARC